MQTREQLNTVLDQLVCPACHGRLEPEAAAVTCAACRLRYPVEDGIPVLLATRAHLSVNPPSK